MRLWCVFEAFIAMERRITIMLAGERCNLALERRAVLRPAKVLSTIGQIHPLRRLCFIDLLESIFGVFRYIFDCVDVAGSLLLGMEAWKGFLGRLPRLV